MNNLKIVNNLFPDFVSQCPVNNWCLAFVIWNKHTLSMVENDPLVFPFCIWDGIPTMAINFITLILQVCTFSTQASCWGKGHWCGSTYMAVRLSDINPKTGKNCIFLWKFNGLVLGLVGLNDAKGIDVAQPIWPWGCPTYAPKQAKNAFLVFLGRFWAYAGQPHNHIG